MRFTDELYDGNEDDAESIPSINLSDDNFGFQEPQPSNHKAINFSPIHEA